MCYAVDFARRVGERQADVIKSRCGVVVDRSIQVDAGNDGRAVAKVPKVGDICRVSCVAEPFKVRRIGVDAGSVCGTETTQQFTREHIVMIAVPTVVVHVRPLLLTRIKRFPGFYHKQFRADAGHDVLIGSKLICGKRIQNKTVFRNPVPVNPLQRDRESRHHQTVFYVASNKLEAVGIVAILLIHLIVSGIDQLRLTVSIHIADYRTIATCVAAPRREIGVCHGEIGQIISVMIKPENLL